MALGPGRYDELCTLVREMAQAASAVVIVFGGHRGHGFSMQADAETMARLPEILEGMARTIRRDLEGKSP